MTIKQEIILQISQFLMMVLGTLIFKNAWIGASIGAVPILIIGVIMIYSTKKE